MIEHLEKAKVLLAVREQLAKTGSRETQVAFNKLLRTLETLPLSRP